MQMHWALNQETDFNQQLERPLKIVIGQRAYTFGRLKKISIKWKNKEIHMCFGLSLIMVLWNMGLAN